MRLFLLSMNLKCGPRQVGTFCTILGVLEGLIEFASKRRKSPQPIFTVLNNQIVVRLIYNYKFVESKQRMLFELFGLLFLEQKINLEICL